MKILLAILLFLVVPAWGRCGDIEIIDSRLFKGYTTIVYTNDEGRECKLNIRISDLNREDEIENWFDKITEEECGPVNSDGAVVEIGLD